MAAAFTRIAAVADFPAGSMKQIQVVPGNDASNVLLVHASTGKWFVTSPKCTHYGAPLEKGTLSGESVVCPWHGACFSCATGDIEDAPALDPLHAYKVKVVGDEVHMEVPVEWPGSHKGSLKMAGADAGNTTKVVIVGGGAAGAVAAQTLRESGFTGVVKVLTAEAHLPYDRIQLSKGVGKAAEDVLLRSAAWYEEAGIEVVTGATVASVDVGSKTVVIGGGATETYDALLLATGSKARELPVPGSGLEGVHTLRTPEDSAALAASLSPEANLVAIGGGFISVEFAASVIAKGLAKTVTIATVSDPFQRVFGTDIGCMVKAKLQAKGIGFASSARAAELVGAAGSVTGVKLQDGTLLPADVVLAGVGAEPVLPTITGVQGSILGPRGGVTVSAGMQVVADTGAAVPGLWAAGDIARFPFAQAAGASVRIEHWDVAQQQGRVAAQNIVASLAEGAGAATAAGSASVTPFTTVPFFWTALAGVGNIRYTGHPTKGYDTIVYDSGAPPTMESPNFIAYYVKDGAVVAAATLGSDPASTNIQRLLGAGAMPSAADLESGKVKAADFAALAAAL